MYNHTYETLANKKRSVIEEDMLRDFEACMEGIQGLEDIMIDSRRCQGEKYVTQAIIAASRGQRALEIRMQYLVTKIIHGEATAEKGWKEHAKEETQRTQGKFSAAVTKDLQLSLIHI